MEFVARLKQRREFKDVKVSPMLVLARAVCLAMRRTPEINAWWDEAAQEIVYKSYVNLGIAAATPRGLVVPNVKDAESLSLLELAEALGVLAETAREGKTQPAEMAGGTFTITNVGVFGVDAGTPIINPGESAIIAFGAVRKQPWVVEDQIVLSRHHDPGAVLRPPVHRRCSRARSSWPTWPRSWRTRRRRCCSERRYPNPERYRSFDLLCEDVVPLRVTATAAAVAGGLLTLAGGGSTAPAEAAPTGKMTVMFVGNNWAGTATIVDAVTGRSWPPSTWCPTASRSCRRS